MAVRFSSAYARPSIVLDPHHPSYAKYKGNTIAIDNRGGASAVVKHLHDRGAKSLVFVQVEDQHLSHVERWKGTRQTWQELASADTLLIGRELRLRICAHVEAEDDRLGGVREVDVGLRDAADARMHDAGRDLLVAELGERTHDRLRRSRIQVCPQQVKQRRVRQRAVGLEAAPDESGEALARSAGAPFSHQPRFAHPGLAGENGHLPMAASRLLDQAIERGQLRFATDQ